MNILETKIKDSFLIKTEKIHDNRGFFTRLWDKEIFEKLNMITNVQQCSVSFNLKKVIIIAKPTAASAADTVKIKKTKI